ncbi:uncharacterized protein B0H18DRAFT_1122024 [Fomitopsis serialis]|uniref:uncharacterized protein n=1 Tax=Fomitopsis serialis TaxID=139415 RepID=UPI0020079703|nr:uncharacterized protein B0H18DRAFT_1122024 [Neoantrodia serialis]KAH9920294.1 hypothetical protein B0H18DRAFT_1122024 [Neoantrodia serialis]
MKLSRRCKSRQVASWTLAFYLLPSLPPTSPLTSITYLISLHQMGKSKKSDKSSRSRSRSRSLSPEKEKTKKSSSKRKEAPTSSSSHRNNSGKSSSDSSSESEPETEPEKEPPRKKRISRRNQESDSEQPVQTNAIQATVSLPETAPVAAQDAREEGNMALTIAVRPSHIRKIQIRK